MNCKKDELERALAHNTVLTLWFLQHFGVVRDACFHKQSKLWLLPTMRDK